MLIRSPALRRLSALSAACLLGVAMPALPAFGKEKTKTKPAAAESAMPEFDYSITIPEIDSVDSNVEDAVLLEILNGNLADNADALAGLDATSITVPEISISVSGQQDDRAFEASTTLTDLVLENVSDGVAGSVSIGSIESTSDDADFTLGEMSASDLDIGAILGMYGLVEPAEGTEFKTIYADFNAEGGTLTSEDVDCTFGTTSGAKFKARPFRSSVGEMMLMLQSIDADSEDVDPETLSALLRLYADILTSFETSEVTFGGFSCEGVDEDDRPMTFSVAGMTMGAMTPGIYPSISMDGLEILVEGDGMVAVDNMTFKPIDLRNVIATLESIPDAVDDAWFEANLRGFIPDFEGFTFSGIDVDVTDPEVEGERIKASVGRFDLTLHDYLNGIPTHAEVSADNIRGDVPADSGDETLDQLYALGVTEIDAGFRIALGWNEADSTIDIEEVSMTGADLATVMLTGTLANATAELFDLDTDTALAAAMGLAVTALDLSIVDDGLTDIAIAAIAADQGADPETLRPIYADLAEGSVIGLLAGMADAAKLGSAVSDFISGAATTLEIGVRSKSEAGIGMVEFMVAEQNPMSLLNQINITAVAK